MFLAMLGFFRLESGFDATCKCLGIGSKKGSKRFVLLTVRDRLGCREVVVGVGCCSDMASVGRPPPNVIMI
jgi:hypothetical protein